MAAASWFGESGKENFPILTDNVEAEIKKRLMWTKKTWVSEGQEDSRLNKLINSLKHWHKKLEKAIDERSMVFTVFNETCDTRISVMKLFTALDKLKIDFFITGISDFRNPRYLGVQFRTPEQKATVEGKLRKIEEDHVINLDWASEQETNTIKAHWVPVNIDAEQVKKVLDKFFEIQEIHREDRSVLDGRTYKASLVTFKGILKEGFTIEDVPHLETINGIEILFTIYGRKPLCLTCSKLGHRAYECPTPYCSKCKKLHVRNEECLSINSAKPSYAEMLKGEENDADQEAKLEGSGEIITEENYDLKTIKGKNKVSKSVNKGNSDEKKAEKTENERSSDEESDNEDSDVDITEVEAVKNIASYIKELNEFKIDALSKGGEGGLPVVPKHKEESPQHMDTDEMLVNPQKLKRKIKETGVGSVQSEKDGQGEGLEWTTYYGRRGRGRRRLQTDKKFDKINERREFVFSD